MTSGYFSSPFSLAFFNVLGKSTLGADLRYSFIYFCRFFFFSLPHGLIMITAFLTARFKQSGRSFVGPPSISLAYGKLK